MKRKRYTEEQIGFALRQHEAGTPVTEIVRKMGIAEQTFYRWKKKMGDSNWSSEILKKLPFCIMLLVVFESSFEVAQAEEPIRSDEIDLLCKAIVASDSIDKKARAYRKLVSKSDCQQLSELKRHPSLEIRLFASWQMHTEKAGRMRSHPERFLGFLESALKVDCTPRWSAAVNYMSEIYRPELSEGIRAQYSHFAFLESFPGDIHVNLNLARERHRTGQNLRAPLNVDISTMRIHVGSGSVPLDLSLWTFHREKLRPKKSYDKVSVRIGKRHTFLVIYDESGSSYSLNALSNTTGKLEWTAEVWGFAQEKDLPEQTPLFHDVIIQANGHTVVLFGLGYNWVYVEAFMAETGKCICRFNPNYWLKLETD